MKRPHQHQVTGLWLRRVEENRGAVWRHAYSINGTPFWHASLTPTADSVSGTSRSKSSNGSGRSSTPLATLNSVVAAPTPREIVATAAIGITRLESTKACAPQKSKAAQFRSNYRWFPVESVEPVGSAAILARGWRTIPSPLTPFRFRTRVRTVARVARDLLTLVSAAARSHPATYPQA